VDGERGGDDKLCSRLLIVRCTDVQMNLIV
jgi:hypothetical protein